MILRPATLADAPLLGEWDTRPHVIAATGSTDKADWAREIAEDPNWQELLIAEVDGRPIGVIRSIDPAREVTRYWGDVEPDLRALDIWIGEEADLGRGYGARMMTLALDHCFAALEVKGVLIDPLTANVRAIRFYQRLGFEFVERRFFGPDECDVYWLARERWLDRRPEPSA